MKTFLQYLKEERIDSVMREYTKHLSPGVIERIIAIDPTSDGNDVSEYGIWLLNVYRAKPFNINADLVRHLSKGIEYFEHHRHSFHHPFDNIKNFDDVDEFLDFIHSV